MDEMKFSFKRVGDIVTGEVIEINDRGATLVIDGCPGLDAYIFNDKFSKDGTTIQNSLKIGDKIEVKIMKINMDEANYILVSRLPLLEKNEKEMIKNSYNKKENIEVKVKKAIADKGVVATYKGHEIFIPISQLDIDNAKPEDFLNKTITVRITELTYERGNERYVGSRKIVQKQELYEQREKALAELKEGDVVTGVVSSFEKFGIFVKIGLVQGLLRFSQVTHSKQEKAEEILKVNDPVEVKILKIDGNKIDLSRKALLPTPFNLYVKDNKVSSKIKGKVAQKLAFGLIIELAPDVTGLLHQNEYSWNPNDNLASCVRIGDELEVVIIGINHKDERISLSRKQLFDNPWSRVEAKRGDVVDAKVSAITPGKSITVLACGVEGTININELSFEKISKIEDFFAVGDELKATVKNVDKNAWILELSLRELKEKEAKAEYEKYMNSQTEEEATNTVGDILGLKLKK